MATKKVIEKKTGEKYASKAAMAKHEKGESKTMQKKEVKTFAKKGTPLHQASKIMDRADSVIKGGAKAMPKTKVAPAKMKKC